MKSFPHIPNIEHTNINGNIWVEEEIDGLPLRFSVDNTNMITIGDYKHIFDNYNTPICYRRCIEYIRSNLDYEYLQSLNDISGKITFFGKSTNYCGIEYDWQSIPPFVGFDIHIQSYGFLPTEEVHTIYSDLGLDSTHVFTKENEQTLDKIPISKWSNSKAKGVIFREQGGGRAKMERETNVKYIDDQDEIVQNFVTDKRINRIIKRIENMRFERIFDELLFDIHREMYGPMNQLNIDEDSFHSELSACIESTLNNTDIPSKVP